MLRKRYVELSRQFRSIGECPYCHGISFNFRVEQLDLYTFIGATEIRILRKRVSEGADLNILTTEFEELSIEEFEVSECEKCGHIMSSPRSGGR